MPRPRRRIPRELFETRSHAWPCASPVSTPRPWRSAAPSPRSSSASPPSRPWPASSPASSCLFCATLAQGADRLLVPNSVLVDLVVIPLREPEKVDLRARFSTTASPRRIEERLLDAVTATPLRPEDGSQLAEEVLEALRQPVGADG